MIILVWAVAILAYLSMGWFSVLFYNIGQVKQYGHILDDEDEIMGRIIIFIFWPLAIITMLILKANAAGRRIATEAGKEHRAKLEEERIKAEKAAKFKKLMDKVKADAEKAEIAKLAAQKLLDETNFKRSEETNWKAAQ